MAPLMPGQNKLGVNRILSTEGRPQAPHLTFCLVDSKVYSLQSSLYILQSNLESTVWFTVDSTVYIIVYSLKYSLQNMTVIV